MALWNILYRMLKYFRLVFLSFLDAFRENIGYHSASLSYQFLTVMGSLFMFLGFVSFYLPFLEPAKLYQALKNLLPSYADLVIAKLLPIYRNKGLGSAFSLLLAYYFSVSFAKSLNTAFGYVYRKKPVKAELFFWTAIPFMLLLYTSILSFAITLFALSKSLLGSLYQRLTEFLNLFLLFLILVMLYASYFRFRKGVILSSVFVSVMLLLLNRLFSSLLLKLVSMNPLFSFMGTPLVFLLWLYYSFFCLLLGVCLLRRLDEPF